MLRVAAYIGAPPSGGPSGSDCYTCVLYAMGEEAGNHDAHASFVERSKCQMGLGILVQTANDQEAWRLAGFEVDEDRSGERREAWLYSSGRKPLDTALS